MKSLALASLFILASSTAQAASLDAILAEDPASLFASKNYERLVHNDDGRVTIVGPRFGSPDGTQLKISKSSDLSGVCALFGFGKSVDRGLVAAGHAERAVEISAEGKFKSFVEPGNSGRFGTTPLARIVSIVCEHEADTRISQRAKFLTNDDGTITIVDPLFGSFDGDGPHWISAVSNPNGVCKRFGLGAFVPLSLIEASYGWRTVALGADGRFTAFFTGSAITSNPRIVSMICQPARPNAT